MRRCDGDSMLRRYPSAIACARSGSGHPGTSTHHCRGSSRRHGSGPRSPWPAGSCESRSPSPPCSCSSPPRCWRSRPRERPLSVPIAVALTLSYAIASRVEFETGVGSTVPTQLLFVPMLFFLPTTAVPLFVAAGLLLGRLPRYLTGYTPVNRAVVELGDALYCHRSRARPGPRRSRHAGPSATGRSTSSRSPPSSPGTSRSRAPASGWDLARHRGSRPASSAGSIVADPLLSSVGLLASLATVVQPYAFLLATPADRRCSRSSPASAACGSSRASSCRVPIAAPRCCSTA